jgi:Ca2+-binding EF-hand superfamily protein
VSLSKEELAQGADAPLKMYFGSLGRSLLSLYQAISGGLSWDDFAAPLVGRIHVLMGLIVVIYVAFATLALLNVVTGVFVESALKSAKEDRDAYMFHHVRQLFQQTHKDDRGTLVWEQFAGLLDNPSMLEFFKYIDVDVSEAKGVFVLLDNDETGEIDLDEFLNGCLGLHGPAKAVHLSTLMYETRGLSKVLEQHSMQVLELLSKCAAALGVATVPAPKVATLMSMDAICQGLNLAPPKPRLSVSGPSADHRRRISP